MNETEQGPVGIRVKVYELQKSIKSIGKDKTNPHFHYTYASAGNVNEKVSEKLEELGLIAQVETTLEDTIVQEGKSAVVIARTLITLIDVETGESMGFSSIGSGTDSSDKHAMKAATASVKYATLATIFGATTDDPEASINPGDTQAKPAPAAERYIPPPTVAQNAVIVNKAVDNVRTMPPRIEVAVPGEYAATQGPQAIGDGSFVVTVPVTNVFNKRPTGRKNANGDPTFSPGTIVSGTSKYDTFNDGELQMARAAQQTKRMLNIVYRVDERYGKNKIEEGGVSVFGEVGEVPVTTEAENY